jgi:uncharacterized protein
MLPAIPQTEVSAGPPPVGTGTCSLSTHLHLSPPGARRPYVYHRLFGNFAWVDDEMHDLLARPLPAMTVASLSDLIGAAETQSLWDSHFLVESPEEERSMIAGWLEDRRQAIHTGKFLGALQISSSNACNFACTYCFADASDLRSAPRQRIAEGPQNISYELASAAIDNVRQVAQQHGRQRIGVKFLGREPLINWKVIRQLLHAYADAGIQWSITTNGSLINDEIASDLKRFDVLTVVSLDGPSAVNDAFRLAKSGGGTYSIVERALRLLAEHGTRYGVSSVITAKSDFASMRPFIDHLVDLGARELELTLVMQTKHVPVSPMTDEVQLAAELADLYEYGREKLLLHGDWIDPFHRIMVTHKFRDEGEPVTPLGSACTATSHQISLEPSGDLFPCRAMSTHYGNILDLDAALHSKPYEDVVMRTFYNVRACHGCMLEGFCQGTCLGSSEEATGDLYGVDERYCRLYRAVASELLERMSAGRIGSVISAFGS